MQTELRAWTVQDSMELYNIGGWGKDFFSVNDAGNVEVTCYTLVAVAALVRVFVPLLAPSLMTYAVLVSAMAWSTGFAMYVCRYWPILSRK